MPVPARNAIAVIAGILLGTLVNMGLITLGPSVIPPPAGMDMTTPEGLAAAMSVLEPKHFVFPFLAHALGTFVGAFVACMLSVSHQTKHALGIGVWFLMGGIAMVVMVPGPIWFTALDLILAYLPMAWLASRLVGAGPRSTERHAAM